MGECIVCMCVCVLCAEYLQNPEESFESPEIEVTDSCVPPCGCWEPNPKSSAKVPSVLKH